MRVHVIEVGINCRF